MAKKTSKPSKRTASGQFKKGHSGNPNGGPKVNRARQGARELTEESLKILASIIRGEPHKRTIITIKEDGSEEKKEYIETPTLNEKRAVAKDILDRGWGKPTQPVGGDSDLDPIDLITTFRDLARAGEPDDK